VIVHERCIKLLREQRTHLAWIGNYGRDIGHAFGTFRRLLPETAARILDIGSGMAGIDVHLAHCYPDAEIHLLDKQGVSKVINCGFNPSADQFAHYNDFDAAIELLRENGVRNRIVCHDMNRDPFPSGPFDVVVSLLSWGFHYPISAYQPNCTGLMVVDVRNDTGGEEALQAFGRAQQVHAGRKFRRIAVQC
jgi:hypothetical protein